MKDDFTAAAAATVILHLASSLKTAGRVEKLNCSKKQEREAGDDKWYRIVAKRNSIL